MLDTSNLKTESENGIMTFKGARYELTESAKQYIDLHYKEKYSLNALAGSLFVNGSYLTRVFRKCTGMTPLEYHNRCRCEEAKKLLARPDLSISFIGNEVGFVSSAHFSRIFKETEGITPSAYRLKHM